MENVEAFLAVIRAGLWEDVKVNGYSLKVNDLPVKIGFEEILCLAEEQTVVGLLKAGIQNIGVTIPLDTR